MTIRFNSPTIARVLNRPTWVGGAVAIIFLVWAAWLGYSYVVAPAPSEEDISSQIIQLKTKDLERLKSSLTTLHQPSPSSTTLPPLLFTPVSQVES